MDTDDECALILDEIAALSNTFAQAETIFRTHKPFPRWWQFRKRIKYKLINIPPNLEEELDDSIKKFLRIEYRSRSLGLSPPFDRDRAKLAVSRAEQIRYILDTLNELASGIITIRKSGRPPENGPAANPIISIPAAIIPPNPDLPSQVTLFQIWKAYPLLDEAAKERVRGNLKTEAAKNPTLSGTTYDDNGKKVNYYDAQLVRKVLKKEEEKHGN